jgi:hypothetical protein
MYPISHPINPLSDMAGKGIIPAAMEKAQQAIMGHGSDKINDLAQETKEMTSSARLTTDYGVKQTSADDWLKVVSQDKQGPMLLEDPLGRERVCRLSSRPCFSIDPVDHPAPDSPLRP